MQNRPVKKLNTCGTRVSQGVKNEHEYIMYSAYPKLWEEVQVADTADDDGKSNGNGNGNGNSNERISFTNAPSIHMPHHIRPETEESFHWARSVRNTQLSTSGKVQVVVDTDDGHGNDHDHELPDKQSYFDVRCFLGIVERSLVIAQEFALSTLFLAGHRCLVCRTNNQNAHEHDDGDDDDNDIQGICAPCSNDRRVLATIQTFTCTLVIIVLSTFMARRQNKYKQWTRQKNVDRLHNRSIDALLIAGILRFLSSVLRTLTASYSSDTVTALAIGGMCLHVLTADYNYANGMSDKARLLYENTNMNANTNTNTNTNTNHRQFSKVRPLFLGGTVSINCVFFSAALLASRLPSGMGTDTGMDTDTGMYTDHSYLFFMWTVVLFAYYPEARYLIAHLHPIRHRAILLGAITMGSSLSAWLLLDGGDGSGVGYGYGYGLERNIFFTVQCSLLVIAPLWKAILRKRKERISGPWDIAHVSVDE